MRSVLAAQDFWGWLEQLGRWLEQFARDYGYPGIFLISFLGAVSIVVPIPYTVIIFMMGHSLNPFFVAVSGGLGSAVGEFFGYFLGYYGRAVISKERQRKMDYILRVLRRYGSIAIFIFALTPLPDDLLFIPLGIMRYSFLNAFIPCLLGKILMCFIVAYSGYWSVEIIGSLFGGEGSPWITIIMTVLLVVILVVMFKVDWEKVFPLHETEEKRKKDSPSGKKGKGNPPTHPPK